MTQEQKDILLKDLCARVPYGVKFKHEGRHTIGKVLSIYPHRKWAGVIYFDDAINHPKECDMGDIKPYLFLLSSMTEEQKEFIKNKFCYDWDIDDHPYSLWAQCIDIGDVDDLIDWFHKNHIDYRGLIEKGLAIDATNLNIY